MASTVFNGTNLLLKAIADGGTLATIGHTTSCTLTVNQELPDATTKDSSGFAENINGLRSFEISFDGLVDYTDAQNAAEFINHIQNRDLIDFSFGTAASGDQLIEGECRVSSIEVSAEMESAVTYSGTLTGTGALTITTNS